MLIVLDGCKTAAQDVPAQPHGTLICIARAGEQLPPALGPFQALFSGQTGGGTTHFEKRGDCDYIALSIPDTMNLDSKPAWVEICLSSKVLLVQHNGHPAMQELEQELESWETSRIVPEKVLYQLFNLLTEKDSARLERIEDDIASLEDSIIEDPPKDTTRQISELRKRLLVLKRYYEGLLATLEDLQENQNNLLSKAMVQLLQLQSNRADRLFHDVLNLRDYVTQVRESYQAQIDIGLNQIMKISTVITTIFLPLTLIVGWYGMNLSMPELNWPHAYPAVIIISIGIIVGSVVYFKRNKWF